MDEPQEGVVLPCCRARFAGLQSTEGVHEQIVGQTVAILVL